jgi:hypothetical protein
MGPGLHPVSVSGKDGGKAVLRDSAWFVMLKALKMLPFFSEIAGAGAAGSNAMAVPGRSCFPRRNLKESPGLILEPVENGFERFRTEIQSAPRPA